MGAVRTHDRRVVKAGWAFQVEGPAETNTNAPVAKLRGHAWGPIDDDTDSLSEDDAIEIGGRTFELLSQPQLWTDMYGNPDHYEVLCEWTDNARTD